MRDMNKYVVPNCSAKWRELGEALGMTSYQLDIIMVDHPYSCEDRCKVMLRKWLDQNPSATWDTLMDAKDSLTGEVYTTTEGINVPQCMMYHNSLIAIKWDRGGGADRE